MISSLNVNFDMNLEKTIELFFILLLLYYLLFVRSLSFGSSKSVKAIVKMLLLACLVYFLYISPVCGTIFALWLIKFMYYDQIQTENFPLYSVSEEESSMNPEASSAVAEPEIGMA